jgi:hypothetical protein
MGPTARDCSRPCQSRSTAVSATGPGDIQTGGPAIRRRGAGAVDLPGARQERNRPPRSGRQAARSPSRRLRGGSPRSPPRGTMARRDSPGGGGSGPQPWNCSGALGTAATAAPRTDRRRKSALVPLDPVDSTAPCAATRGRGDREAPDSRHHTCSDPLRYVRRDLSGRPGRSHPPSRIPTPISARRLGGDARATSQKTRGDNGQGLPAPPRSRTTWSYPQQTRAQIRHFSVAHSAAQTRAQRPP